jgi:carbon monoxide dehydrogenase subunit G
MHLEGTVEIAAEPERVWNVLTDPRQVRPCLPGEPDVEVIDERHMKVTARVGNLFFRTTAVIDIEVVELVAPASATARANGSVMGAPVSAIGGFRLEPVGAAATAVRWQADVTLGGGLAGFAAMAEAPARNAVDRTLDCLKARLEADRTAGSAPAQGVEGAPPAAG